MLDDFYPPKIIRFDQSDHSAVHAKFHINSTVFDHVINMSGLDLKAMHDMNIKKNTLKKCTVMPQDPNKTEFGRY